MAAEKTDQDDVLATGSSWQLSHLVVFSQQSHVGRRFLAAQKTSPDAS